MTVLEHLTSTELSGSALAASGCETVGAIINIAATAEALAVTALGGALQSAAEGKLALSTLEVRTFTAVRAEEQAHCSWRAAICPDLHRAACEPDGL